MAQEKTTLLNLITGIRPPTSGQITFDGIALDSSRARSRYRHQVGYLPQSPSWPGDFTVYQLLDYFARLRKVRNRGQAVTDALAVVDLTDRAQSPLRELSGGQHHRAFLAASVIHDPPIVILDEPTAGLDPLQRIAVRGYIKSIAKDRLVVVATHLVDDVMKVADSITVLDDGIVRWRGVPSSLEDLGTQAKANGGADPDGLGSTRDGAVSDAEAGLLSMLLDQPNSLPGDES